MAVVEVITRAIPTRGNQLFNVPMPVFDSVSAKDADSLAQTLNDFAIRTEENFKQAFTFRGGIVTIELTSAGQVVLDASRSTNFIVPITQSIPLIKGIDIQNTDCGQIISITFKNETDQPIEIHQWPPNVAGTDESLDLRLDIDSKITFRFLVTGDDCDVLTMISNSGSTTERRISCAAKKTTSVKTSRAPSGAAQVALGDTNSGAEWNIQIEVITPGCGGGDGAFIIASESGGLNNLRIKVEFDDLGSTCRKIHGFIMKTGSYHSNQFIESVFSAPLATGSGSNGPSGSTGLGVRLSGTFNSMTGYVWMLEQDGNGAPGVALAFRLYKVQGGSTSSEDWSAGTARNSRPGWTILYDGHIVPEAARYRLTAECDHIKVFNNGELVVDIQDGDITAGAPGMVSSAIKEPEPSFDDPINHTWATNALGDGTDDVILVAGKE